MTSVSMTNHELLFGTPERTMKTLAALSNKYPCDERDPCDSCDNCPFQFAGICRINRANPADSPLINWFRSEVNND